MSYKQIDRLFKKYTRCKQSYEYDEDTKELINRKFTFFIFLILLTLYIYCFRPVHISASLLRVE